MKKIYLFLIGILGCFPLWAETVRVPSPGDLREALMDAEFTGTQLKITGTLNGADLAAIHAADGRLVNVTELDLSEVSLVASDDCYATYKTDAYDCYLEYSSFYYSETCKRDSSHYSTMLGTGVTEIAVYSNNLAGLFAGNTTYQKVVLPKSLGKIGFAMFQESSVSNVVLPSALTEIEERAFESAKLSEVTLPATCKAIDDYAFESSALNSINLENVTKLGSNVFAWAKLQGDITLGAVSEVPSQSFIGCNLFSVQFSEGLKKIGYHAFYGNENLQSLSLPNGLEYVGASSFAGCDIQTMNVPKSITYVGASAFPESCYKSLELDDGVYYINQIAYDFAKSASNMTILNFRSGTVCLSDNLGGTRYGPKTTLVSLTIPSSVKNVGTAAFREYTKLETVTLPEGLEMLGPSTFSGCKSLKNINIPNSLQTIEESTFYGCESLQNVMLPQNLRNIGAYAFKYSGIISISIGENIEYIGYDAFKGCNSLLTMRIDAVAPKEFHISSSAVEKITFGPKVTYVIDGLMKKCSSLLKIAFEEDESNDIPLTIGGSAFEGCSNLKISNLPSRLVKVCDNAFYGIKEISSLYLGQNVTSIGKMSFANIENIGEAYFDNPEIATKSFYCSKIEKIGIGTHVKVIGTSAFDKNSSLTTLTFESRKGISNAYGLRIYSTFNNCKITNVVLPEYDEQNADSILEIINSFNNNSIKEIRMPDNVKTYLTQAFQNCQLENLYLGSNTWEIIEKSFIGNKLKWVDIPFSVQYLNPNSFDAEYLFLHNNYTILIGYSSDKFISNIVCPMNAKKYVENRTDLEVAHVIGYEMELEETDISLKPNEKFQLHAIFKPEEEIPSFPGVKFAWKSLNPDVAVVDENGVVTAVGEGQTQIVVCESYTHAGYGTLCNVKVVESTGIDNLQSDGSAINVEARHGELVISGAKENSKVSIYSLGGQCVRTTTEKSISGLASGIYVVVVENQKVKVALP